jgi:hypothetical protein
MQKATMPGNLLKDTIFFYKEDQVNDIQSKGCCPLFEAEVWRVGLRWLATHAEIFIPQNGLALSS